MRVPSVLFLLAVKACPLVSQFWVPRQNLQECSTIRYRRRKIYGDIRHYTGCSWQDFISGQMQGWYLCREAEPAICQTQRVAGGSKCPFPLPKQPSRGTSWAKKGQKTPIRDKREQKRVRNTLGSARSEEKGEVLWGAWADICCDLWRTHEKEGGAERNGSVLTVALTLLSPDHCLLMKGKEWSLLVGGQWRVEKWWARARVWQSLACLGDKIVSLSLWLV